MFPEPIQITVYTDGSCLGNPGKGGWAAIIRYPDHEHILQGSEKHTTNNRMELTAALESLKDLPLNSQVKLYTDSQYLKRGITEWMPGWKARDWRRKGGVLANVDLWQELDREIQKRTVQWLWVKAHNGHSSNERVDQLAVQAMVKGL